MSPFDQTILRLKNSPNGYQVNLSDLRIDAALEIPAVSPPFLQAGDLYFTQNGQVAYYTQAVNLEAEAGTQFALVQVDLTTRQQRILLGPIEQRYKVMGEWEEGLMLADVYGGTTYKYHLPSQTLNPVSEAIWLGTVYR